MVPAAWPCRSVDRSDLPGSVWAAAGVAARRIGPSIRSTSDNDLRRYIDTVAPRVADVLRGIDPGGQHPGVDSILQLAPFQRRDQLGDAVDRLLAG